MAFDSEKGGNGHGGSPVRAAPFVKAAMANLTLSMSSPGEHYPDSLARRISCISAVTVAVNCA